MKTVLCYGDSLTWGYNAESLSRHPLEDRWPSVLQAALGGEVDGHRRRPERPHHRLRRSSGRRRPQRRTPAADHPGHAHAARPGHHHARRQRHEAVHFGLRVRQQAGHRAAGRDRPPPRLPVRRRAAAGADRVAAAAQRDGRPRFHRDVRRRHRRIAKACGLYRQVADWYGCGFFDAGTVAETTPLDGVHLDAENTRAIGTALAPLVRRCWDFDLKESVRGRILRRHHHRLRPRRLCRGDPRRAARLQDGDRRARASGRHLLQLGLHPDQGAAALGRDLSLRRARQELRPEDRGQGQSRPQGDRRPLARHRAAHEWRRRLPDEEEQGRRHLGRGQAHQGQRNRRVEIDQEADGAAGAAAQEHQGRGHLHRQAHHHRHRRAAARAARHRAGRQADLDLFRGDGADGDAEVAAGHGLGRDRHRVRVASTARWAST